MAGAGGATGCGATIAGAGGATGCGAAIAGAGGATGCGACIGGAIGRGASAAGSGATVCGAGAGGATDAAPPAPETGDVPQPAAGFRPAARIAAWDRAVARDAVVVPEPAPRASTLPVAARHGRAGSADAARACPQPDGRAAPAARRDQARQADGARALPRRPPPACLGPHQRAYELAGPPPPLAPLRSGSSRRAHRGGGRCWMLCRIMQRRDKGTRCCASRGWRHRANCRPRCHRARRCRPALQVHLSCDCRGYANCRRRGAYRLRSDDRTCLGQLSWIDLLCGLPHRARFGQRRRRHHRRGASIGKVVHRNVVDRCHIGDVTDVHLPD